MSDFSSIFAYGDSGDDFSTTDPGNASNMDSSVDFGSYASPSFNTVDNTGAPTTGDFGSWGTPAASQLGSGNTLLNLVGQIFQPLANIGKSSPNTNNVPAPASSILKNPILIGAAILVVAIIVFKK